MRAWASAARCSTPHITRQHGGRFGLTVAATPHAGFSQLAKGYSNVVGGGGREYNNEALGQAPLHIDWVVVRNVELKVVHSAISFTIGFEHLRSATQPAGNAPRVPIMACETR